MTQAEYQPTTTSDILHAKMRQQLCEGEFEPGQRISIRALAQASGTSVMPVRDAVRRLVAEGALHFVDSRTIEVPGLDIQNHRDVLFARIQLEGETAERAFDHLTQGDLRKLREIDASVNAAIRDNDLALYMKGNRAFHFHIYERSDAPILLHLIGILWMRYGPSMRFICSKFGASSIAVDFHWEVTDALAAGDKERFVKAMRSDIEQGMVLLLDEI